MDRLGEGHDRNYEDQRYRASGLNLTIAAIVLWNTVYLDRAVEALKAHGAAISENLTSHLSPLGWAHIGLTGDYVWRSNAGIKGARLRALRPLSHNSLIDP